MNVIQGMRRIGLAATVAVAISAYSNAPGRVGELRRLHRRHT